MIKKISNYQDLLKTVAIVAMIIDHLGLWFLPDMWWMRIPGRAVMPIFCFFAGYNYSYPRSILLKLGALLSCLLMIILDGGFGQNILLTIYIGQWYLYLMDKYHQNTDVHVLIHCTALVLLAPFTLELFEYGALAIAFMIAGRAEALSVNGTRFLPLLSISTALLNFITFEGWFTQAEMLSAFCVIGFAGVALWAKKADMPIGVDLRVVSRNSLIIYFINVSFSAIAFLMIRMW